MDTSKIKSSAFWGERLGYAACLWAILFALNSFYWGMGGRLGVGTLGTGLEDLALAGDPEIIAIVWMTGLLKLIAALFPLALVRRWSGLIPRRLLLLGTWGAGLLFLIYGIINLIQHGLMAAGINPVAHMIGTMRAVYWHLFFWDPIWLIGGILFTLTAWYYSRQS
jgi:hypothetical protein